MIDGVSDVIGENGLDLGYESSIDLGSMLLGLAKYALVTFVVLAAFWLLMQFLRRVIDSPDRRGARGRIRVLETTRLYGDKALHIVRVDNREILVGSSKDGLAYLGEVEAHLEEQSPELDPSAAGLEVVDESHNGLEHAVESSEIRPLKFGKAVRNWWSRVSSLVPRAFSLISQRTRRVQPEAESEATGILRDEARRIKQDLRSFHEVLGEEVAASEETNARGREASLERLRSLAARSERRDVDE